MTPDHLFDPDEPPDWFDDAIMLPLDPVETERSAEWSGPDELDLVMECTAVLSSSFAQRLMAVDRLLQVRISQAGANGRALSDVIARSVRLELVAGLRISEHAAQELMELADSLVHRFPDALTSLMRANITEQHARAMVSLLTEVEAEVAAGLAAEALRLAERHPVGTFRRLLRRRIDDVRAESLAARHERLIGHRHVRHENAGDGMGWLHVYAPVVDTQAAFDRATRMGKVIKAADGETRTLDQIRADVIGDLLIDGQVPQHPEQARGIRAQVMVTVPALALLDDEHAAASDAPVVAGIGPVPIETARRLCAGASGWMRVLTHPETGMVLSVGRDQYSPPESLRRLVKWRADRCLAPGCNMPASRCEIDHTLAWSAGGHTGLSNLGPLCKNHHIVKTHGNWRVTQLAGGVLEWRSPTGRTYLVEPERRVPVFRPERIPEPEPDPAPF